MNRRSIIIAIIVLFSLSVLAAGVKLVSAQAPQPKVSLAPEVALGQPGLSYRYVKSFGTFGVPYIADTTHLNRPMGLFIDGSDNLYMTEDPGNRVLKFSSSKANLMTLGSAGVCAGGNEGFCSPKDIAIDKNGDFWVVDAQRVAQYSPSGTFLQEFPADHPWEAGSDNDHFNQPYGISFDTAGRMYISENQNHRVNVFDMTTGSPVYSSTIGHTGVTGSDPGYFNNPMRIAIDSLDRVYIADFGNNRVQRCTYSDTWSCMVLDSGYNGAQGLAVDKGNNVYITDTWNWRIRKCTSVGICTDWATDTSGHYDLAIDSNGYLYASQPYWDIIEKYDSTGTLIETFVGVEFVPYLTDDYHYFHPRLTIDHANNIIIIEEHGHRLIKLDPNGTPLWTFGVPGVDADDDSHISYPGGVAVDQNNNIYVSDNCKLKIFSPTGTYLGPLGTGCGTGNYQFSWVTGVAVDSNGNIYVSDFNNHRVMIYNSSKSYIGQIGVTGVCSAAKDHLCNPNGLDVDAAGNIYVADPGNSRVQKFNSNRQWQMTIGNGTWGNQFDQFNWIGNVSVDAQGKIFISDWSNNRIQVFDASGNYLTTIGGSWGASSSQLKGTPSVDIDSKGNVYIADWENARIQVFSPGIPGWRQVNINGFGDPQNSGVSALEVFNGQLYAGVSNWTSGATVWRSSDGKSWTRVAEPGFSNVFTNTNAGIPDMAVFNSKLYAGTGWDGQPGQLWRTADGTTWTQVVSDGFGDPYNNTVANLTVFNGFLYAATQVMTNTQAVEIYRSDTGDSGSWVKVVSDGFDGDLNNNVIPGMITFNNNLYVTVDNKVNGVEIWRTENGTNWQQVIGDGFGDTNNIEAGGLAIYKGVLYTGTRNNITGSQVFRSSNGTTWAPVTLNGMGDENNAKGETVFVYEDALYLGFINDVTGLELWRTTNGANWSQANLDGFGDSNNNATLWSNAQAVLDDDLFIGTWNGANGGEIWQMLKQVYLPLTLK